MFHKNTFGAHFFFFIYIYDICEVSNLLKLVLFADDTTLYYSGKDFKNVTEKVEKENITFKSGLTK